MTVKGNDKGAEYERSICTRLSLWVSNHVREDIFWRSAMSGGRANVPLRRKRGANFQAQAGDISAVHEDGHYLLSLFMIECKAYRDFQIDLMVWGGGGAMCPFWEKARDEAHSYNKEPLLIAKQNRKHDIVLTTSAAVKMFSRCGEIGVTTIFPKHGIHIFPLNDLLMLDYQKICNPRDTIKRRRLV